MTDFLPAYSDHGRLSYLPDDFSRSCAPLPRTLFQSRRRRPHRIHIAHVQPDPNPNPRSPFSPISPIFEKLATHHESAKRFLRAFTSPPNSRQEREANKRRSLNLEGLGRLQSSPSPTRSERGDSVGQRFSMVEPMMGGPIAGMQPSRPLLADTVRQSRTWPQKSMISSVRALPEEKPIAAGNGISVNISLAEPMLFLQGFEQTETLERSTAMLRGSLRLRVSKSTKVKAVTLNFCGRAITKWPEGIPPRKVDFEEKNILMKHCWPFFNAQFPTAEAGPCADHVELWSTPDSSSSLKGSLDSLRRDTPMNSSSNLTKEQKRLSLQLNQSRSFGIGEAPPGSSSVNQKGYRTFLPGDYYYNFELPLDSHLPETIDVELGSVKYELEAIVERAGAFRANLVGTKAVTLIRAPSEGSLEQVEPIAISRNWEDQLHYDIVISGKSFPLGAQIPIAFKLTPLAKVQCHRIRVYVTENIEYFCHNKRVHRMEPARKIQLFEKRADSPAVSTYPGSNMRIVAGGGVPYDQRAAAARGEEVPVQDPTNLLGDLFGNSGVGPTEMEFNVQLPGCSAMKEKDRTQRLHFDTTYQNIQVHHWIKIVMRLSRADSNDSGKRRHFEISIDSPFHILSCRATQANIALPAYSSPETEVEPEQPECSCPGAALRRNSPPFIPTLSTVRRRGSSASRSSSPSTASQSGNGIGTLQVIPISTSTSNLINTTATTSAISLARPEQAHFHNLDPNGAASSSSGNANASASSSAAVAAPLARPRPIHMLRQPSFNPPPFDSEDPPPPLETPPPKYDTIASPTSGLADYFARLSDAYEESDPEEEGGAVLGRRPSRVDLPLTPGTRVNRSMDEARPRTWVGV